MCRGRGSVLGSLRGAGSEDQPANRDKSATEDEFQAGDKTQNGFPAFLMPEAFP